MSDTDPQTCGLCGRDKIAKSYNANRGFMVAMQTVHLCPVCDLGEPPLGRP